MSNLVIGLSLTGILLGWVLTRYASASKKQHQKAIELRLKNENYRRVLEAARVVEREEKIFKAQTGHVSSQLSLAKEYELTNIREAINWYSKAADLDSDIAQNALARLCRQNSEDPDGEAKSRYWEQIVKAKHKEPEALFELGRYQVRGFGCGVDIEAGIDNITASAEKEYVAAQLFLGDWYVAEVNRDKSPPMSFGWRLRSAINHDAKGCIKTAFCYQTGLGVTKDRTRAIYWLERAAELGSCEAQFLAAKIHLGSGATDSAIAYTWFSIAHASGHKQAKAERDEVVEYIGIESILNVQNVANSIFKLLKKQPVPPHKVIELFDKVYGREGYRPSEAFLAAAAAGELTEDMLGSVALEVLDGDETDTCVPVSSPKGDDEMQVAEAKALQEMAVDDINQPEDAVANNETAAKEYQQQNWAASWDSFSVEMDKS
ncbi:tetratricopeptide repeat protein [uncultured Photobacterium sp.]|uniref:tetratricopeptide repeat protein n=1 Tax=uncultured Photobacterium sp. TaxID=173973 RepID=UPI0026352170|nr:tetratricopeptide repeat protein [uncultured Photobacterium sp.]